MAYKEENSGGGFFKFILVVVLLVLAFMIGFFISKSMNSSKCDVKGQDDSTAKKQVEVDSRAHRVGSDANGNSYKIFAIDRDMGISVVSNDDQRSVTIEIDKTGIRNYYGVRLDSNSSFIKTFSQKIEQIYIGYFGTEAGSEYLLFLMEDGTIEYIPIYDEVSNSEWNSMYDGEKFNSHGSIYGISDVVSFIYLTVESSSGDYYSIGAQRSDGTIYDLMEFVDTMY